MAGRAFLFVLGQYRRTACALATIGRGDRDEASGGHQANDCSFENGTTQADHCSFSLW
jgi:hypothetical protein